MRKSRLFSLLCAFWPGAGEMYLGLMKRGIGIMILFWFALAIGATMFPWIIFIMPVLWFYSFFDTLTLRNLDYYALTELQERDEFFFQELLGGRFTLGDMVGKYHVALGIGLICAGLLSIYNRLLHWFWRNDILPLWLADFLDYLPSLLLSFAVIAVARREHPTMVTLTLLTIACVIPFLVLFAGTIGIFIVVLYFIFSLFRR